MDRETLVNVLLEKRGAFFISFTAETAADVLKTGNPYKNVTKRSRVNGQVNWNYENAVNNQRAREGNEEYFEAQPRKWGTRLRRADGTLTPLVEHKGKHYLEVRVLGVLETRYFADGVEISVDDIRPWLKTRKPAANQGVEKEIILRDYSLDSINTIVLDHDELTLSAA